MRVREFSQSVSKLLIKWIRYFFVIIDVFFSHKAQREQCMEAVSIVVSAVNSFLGIQLHVMHFITLHQHSNNTILLALGHRERKTDNVSVGFQTLLNTN